MTTIPRNEIQPDQLAEIFNQLPPEQLPVLVAYVLNQIEPLGAHDGRLIRLIKETAGKLPQKTVTVLPGAASTELAA